MLELVGLPQVRGAGDRGGEAGGGGQEQGPGCALDGGQGGDQPDGGMAGDQGRAQGGLGSAADQVSGQHDRAPGQPVGDDASGEQAVRFTLDEWIIRLYPGLSFESAEYGRQAEVVMDVIWSLAGQVLCAGTDVVLDWNSWSRARRAWAIRRCRLEGRDKMAR